MENKFKEITQVGMVVKDANTIISAMRQIFGAEPDEIVVTAENDQRVYKGRKGNFLGQLIFYRFANIELEFIVPIHGESVWKTHLEKHGESMHHLLFEVDSFEQAAAQLEESGLIIEQQGTSVKNIPGLKWAYFDSKGRLPFAVEMKNSHEKLS